MTIIAYSPLAQGLVTGKFHDHPELLKNIGFRKYSSLFKSKGLEKSRPVIEAGEKTGAEIRGDSFANRVELADPFPWRNGRGHSRLDQGQTG